MTEQARTRAAWDGHPKALWRCRCGAMMASEKAMKRHAAGLTMCQHWIGGIKEYRPK